MRYLNLILTLLLAVPSFAETKVGAILPLTGDFALYGENIRKGISSADQTNLDLIYDDEQCSPGAAITAFNNLSSLENIKFFIGPWCGSPQTALAPLIKRSDSLAILGSSAPRKVFKSSGGRMLSVQHSIEEESIFNARQIKSFGYRRVVILFLDNDFSRAHEIAFRKEFKGEVLETITYTMAEAMAIKPIIARIRRLQPDALYVPDAFPLMHGLMKDLKNMGLKTLPVFSVYSAESESTAEAMGRHGEGLLFSYPQIGEAKAFTYFPKLATEILANGIKACPDQEVGCVLNAILKANKFDQHGVLEGQLGLKIFSEGQFQWYQQ